MATKAVTFKMDFSEDQAQTNLTNAKVNLKRTLEDKKNIEKLINSYAVDVRRWQAVVDQF